MTDYIEPSNADIAAAPDSVQGYLDNLIAERDTLADRAAELEAALKSLERRATTVSDLGAVTGPQWTKLTIGILGARTTLKGADHD